MSQSRTRPPLESYRDLCTQAYDLDKPEPPKHELAFFWRLFEERGGVESGVPVLELMSGSGRFLVPFAERGADIDGVDASPQMLAACRARLRERGLTAGIFEQFTQDLDLPREYGYAFLPAGSFTLLDEAAARATLARVRAHLCPGATFAFECMTPRADEAFPWRPGDRSWTRPDGAVITQTFVEPGLDRYDLTVDGEVVASEEERITYHYWEQHDLRAALLDAGFDAVRVVKPYYLDRRAEDELLAVYVARTPG
jgi:SAM-dependent methyltransferase